MTSEDRKFIEDRIQHYKQRIDLRIEQASGAPLLTNKAALLRSADKYAIKVEALEELLDLMDRGFY